MSDMSDDKRDALWAKLLTHAYGEVKANPVFKAGLLDSLKAKAAENAAAEVLTDDEAREREDGNWSRLFAAAYVPCEPAAGFKSGLLASLKAKQAEAAAAEPEAEKPEDRAMRKILTRSYEKVQPRKEFETRLLENLKERQRHTQTVKQETRRRTLYFSGISSIAAAAMIAFVVWAMPAGTQFGPSAPARQDALVAMSKQGAVDQYATISEVSALAALSDGESVVPEPEGLSDAAFRPQTIFAANPLPATVRGIGMEMNTGDGWRAMDETHIARVEPGMLFRPAEGSERPGLGFGDGSSVLVYPDSVMETTTSGFTLRNGELAVMVPDGADSRFRMHFPERDISVEPGTMMTVAAVDPSDYAVGGAPAPVVKVLDGGLALARNDRGVGPLLANQVYAIDNYVTPDLPGRPLCAVECEELERSMAPAGMVLASAAVGGAARFVSSASSGGASLVPEGFEKVGNKWVAADYDNQPTVKVRYLSDAYFTLANQRRDLAHALSLGSEVVFSGGDGTFYEIYK